MKKSSSFNSIGNCLPAGIWIFLSAFPRLVRQQYAKFCTKNTKTRPEQINELKALSRNL